MEITEQFKREIWQKGIIVDKYPSDKVRKDACGAFIRYEDFGDRNSIFGWEIDHIYPASKLKQKGVSVDNIDDIINLRPINCKNNASKGANYPYYTACLTADDENATNVETNTGKVVNRQVQEKLNAFYKVDL